MRALRPHRLLRLSRPRSTPASMPRRGPPNHPQLRARRGLVLRLRNRTRTWKVPRWRRPTITRSTSRRRSCRPGAARLGEPAALIRPALVRCHHSSRKRFGERGRLDVTLMVISVMSDIGAGTLSRVALPERNHRRLSPAALDGRRTALHSFDYERLPNLRLRQRSQREVLRRMRREAGGPERRRRGWSSNSDGPVRRRGGRTALGEQLDPESCAP